MFINIHLPLFNFAYVFFLSSQHICQFCFHCFIPHLAPCFSFVFQFVLQFSSGRYNFWFPLFAGPIYCTIFLLDCFDFAYGCIRICVYSVTLFIVINLYIGLWQFCGGLLFFFFLFSLFFHFSFFFIILIFNFLSLSYFFYIYSFVCLSYSSFPLAVHL